MVDRAEEEVNKIVLQIIMEQEILLQLVHHKEIQEDLVFQHQLLVLQEEVVELLLQEQMQDLIQVEMEEQVLH
jgi:hypothetical protein